MNLPDQSQNIEYKDLHKPINRSSNDVFGLGDLKAKDTELKG